jgi:formate-nitrite transporter family protein
MDSFTNYLARFFAPTLIGTVIGGVSLAAALNYGQVVAEIEGREW